MVVFPESELDHGLIGMYEQTSANNQVSVAKNGKDDPQRTSFIADQAPKVLVRKPVLFSKVCSILGIVLLHSGSRLR